MTEACTAWMGKIETFASCEQEQKKGASGVTATASVAIPRLAAFPVHASGLWTYSGR